MDGLYPHLNGIPTANEEQKKEQQASCCDNAQWVAQWLQGNCDKYRNKHKWILKHRAVAEVKTMGCTWVILFEIIVIVALSLFLRQLVQTYWLTVFNKM